MSIGLTEIEYFADSLNERVNQLLRERHSLRTDLAHESGSSVERDKDFVRSCLDGIINKAVYTEKISRLEHILFFI